MHTAIPEKRISSRHTTRKILILGDVRTGKTRLTVKLLVNLISLGHGPQISVIDVAPQGAAVGGRLSEYLPSIEKMVAQYLVPETVYTPRLTGKTGNEVLRLARENARLTEPLFRTYLGNPTPILVVNDLSIYLQAGDTGLILECISTAEMFLGNSYYGVFFDDKGSGITERERMLVNDIIDTLKLDVIFLR